MSPSDRRRRRVLSQDERELWTAVTRSIAPLRETVESAPEEDAAAPVAPSPPAPLKRRASGTPQVKPAPAKTAPPPSPPPVVPLGRRLRSRVARGAEAIEGRLDLHGLTQSEAHAALLHFLRGAQTRNARLVLVITGKGRRDAGAGERGVLRRQVPLWLKLPEFRAFVVGMEDAHAAHGGEGALYIRVRRQRS